jgi:toxin ParE1/3/4
MGLGLNIRNRATQDLRNQANYMLVNGTADRASAFLTAAEITFEQLRKTPQIGKVTQLVASQLGEIRQWRLKGFTDYLVFYKVQNDTVEILRIFNGTRDLADILSNLDEEI